MRIKISIVLCLASLLLAFSSWGQCPEPAFQLPQGICAGQPINISNTSTGGSTYSWNFCAGTLRTSPGARDMAGVPVTGGSPTIRYSTTVQDGSQFYTFIIGSDFRIYRAVHGADPTNVQRIDALGTITPFLVRPQTIEFVNDGTGWFALAANVADTKLIRLNFGASLETPAANITADSIRIAPESYNDPRGMRIIKNGADYHVFVSSFANNRIIQVKLGSRVGTSILTAFSIPGPSSAAVNDISLVRDCNTWYLLAISSPGFSNRTVVRASLGADLQTFPVYAPVFNYFQTEVPIGLNVAKEGGRFYGFVMSNSGHALRLDFGSNMLNTPNPSVLGIYANLMNSRNPGIVQAGPNQWAIIGGSLTGGSPRLGRLVFTDSCFASVSGSNLFNPAPFSYRKPGKYFVSLDVTNAQGFVRSRLDSITIAAPFTPNFTFTRACGSLAVSFREAANLCTNSNIVAWSWDFGDAIGSSDLQNPTYTYTRAGFYNVTLRLTNTLGLSETVTKRVLVEDGSGIAAISGPTTACSGAPINFQDASNTGLDSARQWLWDFGNGATSTMRNPIYTYPASGNFIVRLTVTGLSGCTYQTSQNISLSPGIALDFSRSGNCQRTEVVFTNTSVPAPGVTPQSYTWNFGDGSPLLTTNAATVRHTYLRADTFLVTLTGTGNNGCTSVLERGMRIYAKPEVGFTFPGFNFIGDVTQFRDTTSVALQTITSRAWVFGDPASGANNTSTLTNPTHVFATPGTYQVQLIVETNQGCRDTLVRPFTILQACPTLDFRLNSSTAPINTNIGQAVTAPAAVRYTLDQCAGDLARTPIALAQLYPSVDIRNTTRVAIVRDGNRWIGLGVNSTDPGQNTNAVHLYDFGNSLSNTPFVSNQGTFPLFARPVDLALQRDGNNWLAWSVNLNGTVIRTTLPDTIGTSPTPLASLNVPLPNAIRNPMKMKLVEDKDSTFLFILSRDGTTANFTRIAFGPDKTTPRVTVLVNTPDLQRSAGLRAIDFVKDCNQWYAVLAGAGLYYRLNYGYSLNNNPTITNITNSFTASGLPTAALSNITELTLRQEGGRNWGFLINDVGTLVRFQFVQGYSGLPSNITNLGNLGVLAGSNWLSLAQVGTEYFAFGSQATTSTLYRLRFPNICSAQLPYFEGTTAQSRPLQYNEPGRYVVTASVADSNGFISTRTDTITITGTLPSDSVACTGGSLNVTNPNKETCQNGNVNLGLNLARPASLQIDACAGELRGAASTITAVPNWLSLVGFDGQRGMDMIYDGQRWVGVVGNQNTLSRFSADTALDLPVVDQSGSFTGFPLQGQQTQSVKLFQRDGEYYAFGVTATNLFLLEFGSNPLNTSLTPRFRLFSGGGNLTGARFMEVVQERDEIYVLITSTASNNLVVYQFGNSVNNFPSQRVIQIPNLATTSGFSMLKDCGTWHGLFSSDGAGVLVQASFGKGMQAEPTFRVVNRSQPNSPVPLFNKLAYDGGSYFAFVLYRQTNGQFFLSRTAFGGSLYNTPGAATNMGNFGGFPGSLSGLFMFKAANSQWNAFLLSETRTIFRLTFGSPCPVARPLFTSSNRADFSYSGAGGYIIEVAATDSTTGAITRLTDSVTIRNPVDANFGFTGQLCRGGTVQFTDLSVRNTPTQISYFWNFGDLADPNAVQSQLQNPTYSFPSPGLYNVRLRTVEGSGCTNDRIIPVRIRAKLTPAFSTPVPACSYDSVSLQDLTSAVGDTIVGRFWTVVDGGGVPVASASGPVGKFSLPTPGNYSVTLRVVSVSGCDSTSAPVPLFINRQGTGFRLEVDSASNCFGSETRLRVIPNPGDPQLLSLEWRLSSGQVFTTPGTKLDTSIVFPSSGVYTLTVTGNNLERCNSVISRSIPIYIRPSANIDFTQACQGADIVFTTPNLSTDGSIVKRKWFFGDGASDTTNNTAAPVHRYAAQGTYPVRLVLESSFGCTREITSSVIVSQSPAANFSHVPACAGDFTSFRDLSNTNGLGSITSYFWNFGDNGTSTQPDPRHQYLNGGRYTVTLTVIAGNCPNTIQRQIDVPSLPLVQVAVTEGCVGQPYILRDNTPYGNNRPLRRQWVVNGIAYSDSIISYLPGTGFTNVDATLEVTTQAGCQSSRSISLVLPDNSTAGFRFLDSVFTAGQPLRIRIQNTSQNAQQFRWSFGNGDTSNAFSPVIEYARPGVYTVCLRAFRNSQCSTELCRVINVQPNRRADVSVKQIFATTNAAGQMAISAEIENLGNVELRLMDLEVRLNQELTIQERWSGSILPGATQLVNLRSNLLTGKSKPQDVICLRANSVTDIDSNQTNNEACTNGSRRFALLSLAPNPSNGSPVTITYSIPRAGKFVLDVVDMMGRVSQTLVNTTLGEGIYTTDLDGNTYTNGVYFVRARFEDERQQSRLVLTR